MFKLFLLIHTLMPGEMPNDQPLPHTITIESPHIYLSEQKCNQAAGAVGFAVHPQMGGIGVNFKCLEVKNIDDKIVFEEDTI